MAQTTVLFDVDGTLVDYNFHHVIAWHRAFLDIDQEVPCWRILRQIGRSGGELTDELLGEELSDKHVEKAKELHTKYFLDSARADAKPAEAVFLGDAVWDVHAAQRAGVPVAAVLTGGTPKQALQEAGAAQVYDGPLDVHKHIEGFGQLVGT